MELLKKENYYKVIDLLKEVYYNHAVVYSVIEGNAPGKIYVDNKENPKSILLFPKNCFFYLLGDYKNNAFLNDLRSLILNVIPNEENAKEIIFFCFNNEWRNKLDALFSNEKIKRIKRKIFDFDKDAFYKYNTNKKQNRKGTLIIKDFNDQISKQININNSWINISDFLSKGIGKVMMENESLISACYSIYRGYNHVEIDIFTNEPYKRKGYAEYVGYYFIKECLSKNIIPSWSCWSYKESSYKLAEKLGFNEKEEIDAHLLIL